MSDLFGFLDPTAVRKPANALAMGFLVGLFSDKAMAKFAELANSLFGVVEVHNDQIRDARQDGAKNLKSGEI